MPRRSSPPPDGLQFDFKLKEGIQFHGGYGEVTAEDVKFSYERIAGLTKPKLDSPYKGDWAPHLQEVQTTGKYEGTIILKEPFAPLMTTTLPVPSGLDRLEEGGRGEGQEVRDQSDRHGAVRVRRVEAEARGAPAAVRGLRRRFGGHARHDLGRARPDPDRRRRSCRRSRSRRARSTSASCRWTRSISFEENDDFTVEKRTSLDYTWIGMNTRSPKLEDINVRQAIRYAIDVPSIIEAAFEGRYERATAIISPGMPIGYWEDAPVYERDLDQAQPVPLPGEQSALGARLQVHRGDGREGDRRDRAGEPRRDRHRRQAHAARQLRLLRAREGGDAQPRPLLRRVRHATRIPPGRRCGSSATRSTSGTGCTGATRSTTGSTTRRSRRADQAVRNDMYIEMQKLWDAAAHTVWLAWPTQLLRHAARAAARD